MTSASARLAETSIYLDRLLVSGAPLLLTTPLARRFRVTRARITQIMNLNHLAPDLQEALLFLPRTAAGRAPITERDLRAVTAQADWGAQRETAAMQAQVDT